MSAMAAARERSSTHDPTFSITNNTVANPVMTVIAKTVARPASERTS
jgi:hypothetical protein